MKTNKIHQLLTRPYAEVLPEFVFHKRLLHKSDLGFFLPALYFDRSSDADVSYVQVFVQPLFTPDVDIDFSYGFRLRTRQGDQGWRIKEAGVVDELVQMTKNMALPFLTSVNSPSGFAARYLPDAVVPRLSIMEDVAYCFLIEGKIRKSRKLIDEIVKWFEDYPEQKAGSPRRVQLYSRVVQVCTILDDNPHEAVSFLDIQKTKSLRALEMVID